jgi:hypothetical protein
VAEGIADEHQSGRDRVAVADRVAEGVAEPAHGQHRRDRLGRSGLQPRRHPGEQLGGAGEGVRVADDAQMPVPGGRHDAQAERAVVAEKRREREKAQVSSGPGEQRRVRRGLDVWVEAEVTAEVDEPAVGDALGDRHLCVVAEPAGARRAAAHGVDDELCVQPFSAGELDTVDLRRGPLGDEQSGDRAGACLDARLPQRDPAQYGIEDGPSTGQRGQVLVVRLSGPVGDEAELLYLDRARGKQRAVNVRESVAEDASAQAEEVVRLAELSDGGAVPAGENGVGVGGRGVGRVLVDQLHVVAGPSQSERRCQPCHSTAEHEHPHGPPPSIRLGPRHRRARRRDLRQPGGVFSL